VDWLVPHDPVDPNATPEARALLKYIYSISNKHMLTGQHNYNNVQMESSTDSTWRLVGKPPVIFGTDFASSPQEIANRENLVKTCIEEYKKGAIIALCWHEVRPKDGEPGTFQQNVQIKIPDDEWTEIITPGTDLYNAWCSQVDVIAKLFKELQDAHVPVLFRPYHEMNGDWFWWGAHRGDTFGTKVIYQHMYDRLVNVDHINNLVWVWNVDRPERADRQFVDYFPGQNCVDILSLDTYEGWKQSYYDDLNALSDGKPLAIAECGGNIPSMSIFETQPKWTYFMIWTGFAQNAGNSGSSVARRGRGQAGPTTLPADILKPFFVNSHMLNWDDPEYLQGMTPVLAASGYPAPAGPGAMPAAPAGRGRRGGGN
jgi:mannan endo-1,4-beta-mannosidase